MTAKKIDRYLSVMGSPMAGLGKEFVRAGKRYGVDPRLLVAISGAESAFGRNIKPGTNNPFGWGPHIPFDSFTDAIHTVAKGLRKGYLNEGRKSIDAIGAKWAPRGVANDPTDLNANWAGNVSKFYRQLGGRIPAQKGAGGRTPALPVPAGRPKAAPARPAAPDTLLASVFRSNNDLIGVDTPSFMQDLLSTLAAPSAAPAPSSPAGAPVPQDPLPRNGSLGGLAELFYDPRGAYDSGQFIKPIGGHKDHLHASVTDPQAMLALINHAQKRGYRVRENPYVDPVDPVHTEGSFHYRPFKGKYNGKQLGQGVDISGGDLGALYDWILGQFKVKR